MISPPDSHQKYGFPHIVFFFFFFSGAEARNLVNAFSYSSAIVACGNAKHWRRALELWEVMTQRGPAPNVVAMNALLGPENHELTEGGMMGDGFGGSSPLSLSIDLI